MKINCKKYDFVNNVTFDKAPKWLDDRPIVNHHRLTEIDTGICL